jgi:hypothetical protein
MRSRIVTPCKVEDDVVTHLLSLARTGCYCLLYKSYIPEAGSAPHPKNISSFRA